MSQNFLVSQQDIAGNFSVDRTTILAWTNKGLPYITGDQGKPHRYHIGITMWWRLGSRLAKKMHLPDLTAAQQIALAREYGDVGDSHKIDTFVKYLSEVGIDENEARCAFSFARGVAAGRQLGVKP